VFKTIKNWREIKKNRCRGATYRRFVRFRVVLERFRVESATRNRLMFSIDERCKIDFGFTIDFGRIDKSESLVHSYIIHLKHWEPQINSREPVHSSFTYRFYQIREQIHRNKCTTRIRRKIRKKSILVNLEFI